MLSVRALHGVEPGLGPGHGLDRAVEYRHRRPVLLEIEEVLGLDDGERAVDAALFEEVAQRTRRGVARVVPAFECQDGTWSPERRPPKASNRIHERKAIGPVS